MLEEAEREAPGNDPVGQLQRAGAPEYGAEGMSGGPEFSYNWDGKFNAGDTVKTVRSTYTILYGFYFQGKRVYRMQGGDQFLEEDLRLVRRSRKNGRKKS